jgi:hypothetical protein
MRIGRSTGLVAILGAGCLALSAGIVNAQATSSPAATPQGSMSKDPANSAENATPTDSTGKHKEKDSSKGAKEQSSKTQPCKPGDNSNVNCKHSGDSPPKQ